jgi:hypothetical protein
MTRLGIVRSLRMNGTTMNGTMMNGGARGNRGPRRVPALAVAAAIAALTTACGAHVHVDVGSGSSASTGQVTFVQEVALAQCMRGHGVPDFPDPDPAGGFNASVLSMLGSSQVRAAYGVCRHLLAGGGPSLGQLMQEAQQEQQQLVRELPALLKFSQCMRRHGVPDYPDPSVNGQSSPAPAKGGDTDPRSPRFQAAVSACQHVLPAGSHISVHASAGTGRG